jgi:hypothetical protein
MTQARGPVSRSRSADVLPEAADERSRQIATRRPATTTSSQRLAWKLPVPENAGWWAYFLRVCLG